MAVAAGAVAQESAPVSDVGAGGLDITADSLEYLADQKLMVGKGNVVIKDQGDELRADYMTVQTETQDVYAKGNVIFLRRPDKVWKGEEFRYNLKTKQGDFGEFDAFSAPYYIKAEDSQRVSENEYILKNVRITTCSGDDPEVALRAREARLIDGKKLRAKGVVFYAGPVPFFYLPSMNRTLGPHPRYFEVVPGYSSKQGAFLLTAYHYPVAEHVRGTTRLDYRSKRGLAYGQDFRWKNDDDTVNGEFRAYYADDDEPFEDEEDEAATGDLVDNERYRLKLSHFQSFTPRDYLIADINYLSDPDIIEDFFDDEFRHQTQPENRVTLTHRADKYTASILVNKRLNDFYENVDRVPEIALDASRQRIGDSGFYYESENSAANLERVFPDGSESEDYDAFRIDSRHTVLYPTRHFGFLNFIPRAGYRGTYYSDTQSESAITNTAVNVDSNGVATVSTNIEQVLVKGGSDVRNLYEIGFETSFKAFKAWDDVIVLEDGDGLRHVAEPYLNYTYNPRPNLRPNDLPQFDAIDRLDKRHDIKIGMRNKYQTRKLNRVHDIVDANVFTFYRIDPARDEEDFDFIFFDTELRLVDRLPIDFDGSFDQYEGEFATFNTQIAYLMEDASSVALEYRHRRDEQNLVAAEVSLWPNMRWSVEAYWRVELESNELEEHSYFLTRRTDCVGYGFGFKQVDDDEQFWFKLWLLAFPDSDIDLGS